MKRTGLFAGCAVLTVLVGIFFYQTVLFGRFPIPTDALVGLYHPWRDLFAPAYPRGVPFKNFLITDPVRQQIPWRKLVADAWKSGRLPKWNPYTFGGTPLVANIQAAPFYPFNILFLFLPFFVAWTTLIAIQPFLAGLFLFWYLRFHKRSVLASLVGSVAWAFGGFSIAWMTWGTIVHTALWIPLVLLCVDELFFIGADKKQVASRLGWMAGVAFGSFMIVTAGHIQIALYMFVLAGAYVIWRYSATKNLPAFFSVMLAVIVALILTSVQWVPLSQFLSESGRIGAADNWQLPGWFFPWQNLAQFIAPDFFGNPATLNYWGVWNYGELIGYIGLIPLLFAVSVLFLPGLPMFFSIAVIASFAGMLPSAISSLPFIFHIPVLSVLQPTRYMSIVDLSFSILSAYGFDALLKNRGRIKISCFIIGVFLLILWGTVIAGTFIHGEPSLVSNLAVAKKNLILPTVLFVFFAGWYVTVVKGKKEWTRGLSIMLFVVIVVDLFRFGWKFTPFTPSAYLYPQTGVLKFLEDQPKPFRVMSLDDRILPPNVSGYYGIESIEGYDPIVSKRYEAYVAASELGKVDLGRKSGFNRIYTAHNIDSQLLPYLNVRYVLSLSDTVRPFLKLVMRDGEVRVYEYTKSEPRAYIATNIIEQQNSVNALTTLLAQGGVPVGIVEQPVKAVAGLLKSDEHIEMTSYNTSDMTYSVSVHDARLIVVLNAYDSHWRATVDGKLVKIIPVNYLFMGVVVPTGTHTVQFTY